MHGVEKVGSENLPTHPPTLSQKVEIRSLPLKLFSINDRQNEALIYSMHNLIVLSLSQVVVTATGIRWF